MPKQKAVFGLWTDIRCSDLNRLLKPHGVRLVVKSSRNWGDQVNVTAHGLSSFTTHIMIEETAALIEDHGCKTTAADLLDCRSKVPNVPVIGGGKS